MSATVLADAFRQLRAGSRLDLPTDYPAAADERERRALRPVLAKAYELDASSWPGTPPSFREDAAVWGLLAWLSVATRWHLPDAAAPLPPAPPTPMNPDEAAAHPLSADLALRYLPPLLQRIGADSPDDVLLAETAPLLAAFPYTGLLSPKPAWPADLPALANATFRGAVVDRVIERDRLDVAQHPDLLPHVRAALGAHAQTLWPRFHRMRGARG